MAMRVVLLLLLVAAPAAFAAVHTVGGSSGWTDSADYPTWASAQTFSVGDTLEFKYGGLHSVAVVNKDGYDNCDAGNAISSHGGGSTKIPLSATGPLYVICPTPGHCSGGMKLSINVVGATSGTPASGSGTPSTGTGTSPAKTGGDSGGAAGFGGFGTFGYVVVALGGLFAYMG